MTDSELCKKFGFPEKPTEHELKLLDNVFKALHAEINEAKTSMLTKAMYAKSSRKQTVLLKNAEGLATAASMLNERFEVLEQLIGERNGQ